MGTKKKRRLTQFYRTNYPTKGYSVRTYVGILTKLDNIPSPSPHPSLKEIKIHHLVFVEIIHAYEIKDQC